MASGLALKPDGLVTQRVGALNERFLSRQPYADRWFSKTLRG